MAVADRGPGEPPPGAQGAALSTPTGNLRSYVRIFVNDEDMRFLDDKATALKAGDTVAIVPAIAGGAGG